MLLPHIMCCTSYTTCTHVCTCIHIQISTYFSSTKLSMVSCNVHGSRYVKFCLGYRIVLHLETLIFLIHSCIFHH